MATVGTLEARLARLQEQIRKAKEASSAVKQRKRAVLQDNEKRRIWVVGTCAMAAMREKRMRELFAKELRKHGRAAGRRGRRAFRRPAGRRPTCRRPRRTRRAQAMDEPANQDGADAARVAAE